MWSMEDPDSGRGRKYHRVIIDECEKAPKFKEAWQRTIRATLADYQGDAWFLSTPKFGNTYFKQMALENPTKLHNWVSWIFTTYDNPHILPSEIDDARSTLDDLTFRCEFLAEDVDITDSPFCYAFKPEVHVQDCQFDSNEITRISFDFNVDPITAIVSQFADNKIKFVREFRLANSDIYALCDQIKAAYPTAAFIITGDASGQNRSALTAGNINYYNIIQQKLSLADGQMVVPSFNPSIADSRVLCNSILQNFDVLIDSSCKYLIEDLKYVEVKEDGSIDKAKDSHRGHLLDAWRYTLNTWHSHLIHIKLYHEETTD